MVLRSSGNGFGNRGGASPLRLETKNHSASAPFAGGSRSKSQSDLASLHGSVYQRHNVVPLTSATIPCATTSRRMSATENRDKGRPKRYGSSHARAFTWTTTLGGKAG